MNSADLLLRNLPPKSKEEEEFHRKMYQEMVLMYEKKGMLKYILSISHTTNV